MTRVRPYRWGALLFAAAALGFDLVDQAIVDVVVLVLIGLVLAVLDVGDRQL